MEKPVKSPPLSPLLYFDEDVDIHLIEALGAQGFKAYCAKDEGMLGKSDEEQLSYATEKGWTFLTHNVKHFRKLHQKYQQSGLNHSGIILAKQKSYDIILNRLLHFLDEVSVEEVKNQLFFLKNYQP